MKNRKKVFQSLTLILQFGAEYDRSHCTLHDVRHMARQEI